MQPRYSTINQIMHWLTAACVGAILPLAWVMTNADKHMVGLGSLFNWHKTLGGMVLIITAFRIVWRSRDGPPPYPIKIAKWDQTLAHAVYWLFFFALIYMPVTGEMMTLFGNNPTALFDLIPTPQILTPNPSISATFAQLHSWGQWAIYGLVFLHVAGVVFHLIWGRDGVLGRMLPPYSSEPPLD